ncbi:DNA repair protein RecO [Patescibacteria group bacterium]|nr:DNA repair protein RecO [Patescibacteria group bacterium]
MITHYRTSGFVIKKNDTGEHGRIFTVFAQDFGKIKVLGRAIRKIASKLKSGINVVSLSEIEFIQGKAYKTLTDAMVLEKFEGIKSNLEKLRTAYKINEPVDSLIKGEEKDEKIFSLLKKTYSRLNDLEFDSKQLRLLYFYFIWNLFYLLGYKPQLYKCANCQKKLVLGFFYFSSKEGGVICRACFKDDKESRRTCPENCRRINSDVIKTLRLILKREWNTLFKLKIPPFSQKLLKDITNDYYFHLLNENNN